VSKLLPTLHCKELLGMLQPCLELVDDSSVWQPVERIKGRVLSTHVGVELPF